MGLALEGVAQCLATEEHVQHINTMYFRVLFYRCTVMSLNIYFVDIFSCIHGSNGDGAMFYRQALKLYNDIELDQCL